MSAPTRRPPASETLPITELLSYQLTRTARALSRSAALRYRREFDVSLGEWRTLALLGAAEPQTVNRLARLAGLDKAQMSRVVTKLVDRGLVSRAFGPGRTTELSLTRDGTKLYRGLIGAANERNRAFLESLEPEERKALASALVKLTDLARSLEHAER
jgi:DNA-binding MarR family transcriptional regulator